MTGLALLLFISTLALRELTFAKERKRWESERKDLYSRIQAGSLQEYERIQREPSSSVQKDREQRIAEQTEKMGVMREDLQFPSHWNGVKR